MAEDKVNDEEDEDEEIVDDEGTVRTDKEADNDAKESFDGVDAGDTGLVADGLDWSVERCVGGGKGGSGIG